MIFNEKCSVLYIGRNNPEHEYRLSQVLSESDTVRDLGVYMSSKLENHYHSMTKKAYTRSFMISKSFTSKSKKNMTRAFNVYVINLIGILNYCGTNI